MGYKVEKSTGDIVISGWEEGIAESPYKGISDMKNVQIISIPKEASVNFSTSQISATNTTGTMTTSSAGSDTVTLTGGLEKYQAIQFSVLSDATKGISLNTPYWLKNISSGVYELHTNNAVLVGSLVNITADSLTGTWATINMSQPKYFNHFATPYTDRYFMVDSAGKKFYVSMGTTNSNDWVIQN